MKNLPKNGIMIAFGELFLKSKSVGNLFRKKLAQNISVLLKNREVDFKMQPFRERIFIETSSPSRAVKIIKEIFGISWFSECLFFQDTTLEQFAKFFDENYNQWVKSTKTFAIRLKLESGIVKENKEKIVRRLAKNIDRKVDLTNPKVEISAEIRKNGFYLYFKKQKGAGGYPVGSGGKVLALMSGGIDSPVSAYSIARRGTASVWLHFHSFPLVSNASIEKIKQITEIARRYQPKIKIYFVPFSKAQVEIKTKVAPEYRILLYRRLMFRIAEKIAQKEKCLALVTGESLGQVSSQTLPNMSIIQDAVKIPVLRPLISLDKEEIITIAKKIGTFDISIKPQEDCCTLFTPKHSTAEGKLETVKEFEKKINPAKIIREALKSAKIEIL